MANYKHCGLVGVEILIYFVMFISVWAFGSVYTFSLEWFPIYDWAAKTVSLLSLLVFLIYFNFLHKSKSNKKFSTRVDQMYTIVLFVIGLWIISHTGISVLNARAKFNTSDLSFYYFESFIKFLPHSYDSDSSLRAFFEYSGIFLFFLTLRKWFREDPLLSNEKRLGSLHNTRLHRFLLFVGINLSLLAIIGIIQRLTGTNKLLWLVEPHVNKNPLDQFGPYPYRGNAAQIINLVWPCFLATLIYGSKYSKSLRSLFTNLGKDSSIILFPLLVFLIVSPVVTSSRAGAFLTFFNLCFCVLALISFKRILKPRVMATCLTALLIFFGLSWWLGGENLVKRFKKDGWQDSTRVEAHDHSMKMVEDYFILGSGPQTFSKLFKIYVDHPNQSRRFYHLHDDYVEYLINYGIITFSIAVLGLLIILSHFWLGSSGYSVPNGFYFCVLAGMLSCLIHAKIDFPFQVYSILLYFVALCAVISSIKMQN